MQQTRYGILYFIDTSSHDKMQFFISTAARINKKSELFITIIYTIRLTKRIFAKQHAFYM